MKYYKTNRTSRTGKKFTALAGQIEVCQAAQKHLARQLGFESFRGKAGVAYGGLGCVLFKTVPNMTFWRKVEDGYLPRAKGKLGKRVAKAIDKLPTISAEQLNSCVKFKPTDGFRAIGVNFKNAECFLFQLEDEWIYTPPKDCIEITEEDFKNLGK